MTSQSPLPRRVSRTVDHEGKWLRYVRVEYVNDASETTHEWELVERTTSDPASAADGVDIITSVENSPQGKDDCFAFVLVYRPPVDKLMLEFPAGLLEAGQSVTEAAERELKEETGLTGRVGAATISPTLYTDPWKSNETGALVHVTVDLGEEVNHAPEQELEATEFIEVVYLPKRGLLEAIHALQKARGERVAVESKVYAFALGLQLGEQLARG